MASLLQTVKTKLALQAHQKVLGLFEGEYGSVFKGRSMDFDDLREYVAGDDVKDIDWKASARTGQTLIKRYVAIRKHNVLLVVDVGRDMAALASAHESKRDVALLICGALCYITQRHGDLIGLVAGDATTTKYFPLKSSNDHLELLLRFISNRARLGAPASNLSNQLRYVGRAIARRMMLVVITDDAVLSTDEERQLRRLRAQHDVLWICIGDIDLTSPKLFDSDLHDVSGETELAAYIRRDRKLRRQYQETALRRQHTNEALLEHLGIASQRINGSDDVIPGLVKLLHKQKHAR